MNKFAPRLFQIALLAGLTALFSGCAAVAEGLALAAEEMRAEQEARDYAYPYGYPRPSSDTSAAGIK
jgi:hypothetical protein